MGVAPRPKAPSAGRDRLVVAALVVLLLALLLASRALRSLDRPREAVAEVRGGPLAPQLRGTVRFQQMAEGVRVVATIDGLPPYTPGLVPIGPHGFHIHETGDCTVGDATNPFTAAGGHYDPDSQPHGNHAGDFPVLFSFGGHGTLQFETSRFTVDQIVGRAVIVHENPDDFRSQPAGASGLRLGCGVIRR